MVRRHGPPARTPIAKVLAALLASTLALATAGDGLATRHVIADFQFLRACTDPAPSQQCNEAAYVESFSRLTTAKRVTVSFWADPAGCSSFRLHFVKDGRPVLVTAPLAPGEVIQDVRLGRVEQRWRMWAEGIAGGCNAGHLAEWGGDGSWKATLVSARDRR